MPNIFEAGACLLSVNTHTLDIKARIASKTQTLRIYQDSLKMTDLALVERLTCFEWEPGESIITVTGVVL